MSKKMPLISIAITCFNAEATIAKSIFSALNQSWKNKEILVIDDNSTDS
jgi:glycosyltransferase involved in cell wall biosynthesis